MPTHSAGQDAPPPDILQIILTPNGHLLLQPDPESDQAVPTKIAHLLAEAFTQGDGHGLLILGAARMPDGLPPTLAFWRRFAHSYVTRFCAETGHQPGTIRSPVAVPPNHFTTLIASAPTMVGGEYLAPEVLQRLWTEVQEALLAAGERTEGGAPTFLATLDPAWNMVGRVCLHLAENKASADRPFAFLATYATRLGRGGKVQHQPLNAALQEYALDRDRLLALLAPVQRAATGCPWVAELVRTKAMFQAQAWTPDQAYRFLSDIPILEQSGLVVRVPDWWSPANRRRSRVTATVSIGAPDNGSLGGESILDFDVQVALDGERLSEDEWQQLQQATSNLVFLKGRWTEVDQDRIAQALRHWREVEGHVSDNGLTFAQGMRLLAGVPLAPGNAADETLAHVPWTQFVTDRKVGELLAQLRDPTLVGSAAPGSDLKATLRPYQELGVRWLWLLHQLGLGACLADDMGLGKTLQVIALLLRIRRDTDRHSVSLIVVPASLIANWSAELARFAPDLRVLIAHPSALSSAGIGALDEKRLASHDVVITSYGTLLRHKWQELIRWRLVVLDEAQAIKNPGSRQTRAVKALRSHARIVLTGTPIENRLSDLWSLFDFTCPGLLGTHTQFARYVKSLSTEGYGPLRELVRPFILRRLKTDRRVIADLPDKTEVESFCSLSKRQAVLYQQSVDAFRKQLEAQVDGVQRRGMVLAYMMRFKQICNHPSQLLDDGAYDEADSGKFQRLRELCEEIGARQQKVLIFTQFRQIIDHLAEFLAEVFGRPGLCLHGGTAVKNRQALVDRFSRDDGPPFFILSLKAGGTGLNLTAASHVIHFDRWWNPAVENQATDRAYRIGQRHNVLVHKFLCRGTIEERIAGLLHAKLALSNDVLGGSGEIPLTELSNDELLDLVSLDIGKAIGDG